ncbi:MAG: dinitrogenase iron-molybdenum cofactor biosynthesis protein [Clostridia bacterium]|nr:NifB/NifX family molybdenum-iron cluster-binding protein [Candidatus Pelethousia sp.]NCB29977.1 dinitrogenase iron-molybdenum cofactor biosynthesis protein [Clostridia bacterium]
MKIAMPVEDKSLDSGVCPSFGRAPYFLFYNMLTNASYFLQNAAATSQGGAGIKAAQVIADEKVQALLTPRCGENAAQVLKESGVVLYKTVAGTARENIDALAEGKLLLLGDIHPGFHGHER